MPNNTLNSFNLNLKTKYMGAQGGGVVDHQSQVKIYRYIVCVCACECVCVCVYVCACERVQGGTHGVAIFVTTHAAETINQYRRCIGVGQVTLGTSVQVITRMQRIPKYRRCVGVQMQRPLIEQRQGRVLHHSSVCWTPIESMIAQHTFHQNWCTMEMIQHINVKNDYCVRILS